VGWSVSEPGFGVTVVVPTYNAELTLQRLVERLEPALRSLGSEFELVLVNDGSRDRSWDIIKEQVANHTWVRGISLTRNFGQHNALLCGIRAARYDVVVTMDDDLQHPPEQIGLLLAALSNGFDVVYGIPREGRHGIWRDFASRTSKRIMRLAFDAEIPQGAGAFRAFKTSLREVFEKYHSPSVSIDVLLTWASTKVGSVVVDLDPRLAGESNYTLCKLIGHAVTMTTGFSTTPLRLASFMGFFFTAFGGLILTYVVGRYMIQGSIVPGFPFLASVIAIFSGVQLFCLGIIGEYLARIYLRSLGKPAYFILEECGLGNLQDGERIGESGGRDRSTSEHRER
jgi:glycosyltransferase involved in cell wall biosynthesis